MSLAFKNKKNFFQILQLLLLLIIVSCGSDGCYYDDVQNVKDKNPVYIVNEQVTVQADGYYPGSQSSSQQTPVYNQYVQSGVIIQPTIATTINLKVSGEVSVCNGKESSALKTKINVPSSDCMSCNSKKTADACGSCPGNDSDGYQGTCVSYCNDNPGKKCIYGATGNLKEYCDANCIYGSKYYIYGNDGNGTVLTRNVYPNDKVTFFVDAPTVCAPADNSPGHSAAPDLNRYAPYYSGLPLYPKDLNCVAGSSSLNDDSKAAKAACTPTKDNKLIHKNKHGVCWVSTGSGLFIQLGGSQGECYSGSGSGTSQCLMLSNTNNPQSGGAYPANGLYPDPILNPDSSSAQSSVPTFVTMGGSPSCQSPSAQNTCQIKGSDGKYLQNNYTCQQTKRVFVNGSGQTIDYIRGLVEDEKNTFSDNVGGYTIYVDHESCRASKGDPSNVNKTNSAGGKVGALSVVLVPSQCDPNNPSSTGVCISSNFLVVNLDEVKVSNCASSKASKCIPEDNKPFCDPCADSGSKKFCPAWDSVCVAGDNSANYYSLKPSDIFNSLPKSGYQMWFKVNNSDAHPELSRGNLKVEVAYGAEPAGISSTIADIITSFSEGIMASLADQFVNITCTGDPQSCSCNSSEEGCEYSYMYYIRILLYFYIVGLGFMFVMGMTKISQADLIIRLFKIGVILALTRSDSWHFFYNNFFNIFLSGTAEIIDLAINREFSDFVSGPCDCVPTGMKQGGNVGPPLTGSCPDGYIRNPFCFVDFGFNMMFTNPNTWKKLAAYMILSPINFLMFFVMIWGIFLYVMAVFKAVVVYIMSIISIAILLLLAPIFIPFCLFRVTTSLFENWLKYLIERTLEPVLLLIGLNLITVVLYMILQEILDFQVCWESVAPVGVPSALQSLAGSGSNMFAIKFFQPQGMAPGGGGASTYSLSMSFAYFMMFIMVLLLMKNYGSYISMIVQRISNLRLQQFVTTGNRGRGGGVNSIAEIPGRMASYMVGQDATSKVRRESEIRKRIEMRQSGAEVTANTETGADEAEQKDLGERSREGSSAEPVTKSDATTSGASKYSPPTRPTSTPAYEPPSSSEDSEDAAAAGEGEPPITRRGGV